MGDADMRPLVIGYRGRPYGLQANNVGLSVIPPLRGTVTVCHQLNDIRRRPFPNKILPS